MKIKQLKTTKIKLYKPSFQNQKPSNSQSQRKSTQLVFKSQINTIHNYFNLLHSLFGKKTQIKQLLKNVPQQDSLRQHYIDQTQQFKNIALERTTKIDGKHEESLQSTNVDLPIYNNGCIGLEKTRLAQSGSTYRRKNINKRKGQIIKGNTRSKSSVVMQKMQILSQRLLKKESQSCHIQTCITEDIQHFVPIGKFGYSIEKYKSMGIQLQKQNSVTKLNLGTFDDKYHLERLQSQRITRRLKSQTTQILSKTRYHSSFQKRHSVQSTHKKMVTTATQRCREKQFTPWQLTFIQN